MLLIAGGDSHHPMNDKSRCEVFLDDIRRRQPDAVVLMGDIWDAYRIARFTHTMKDAPNTLEELDSVQRFLYWVRKAAGPARVVYLKGNHELRLDKHMADRVPEIYKLEAANLPELLKLADIGIEWVDDHDDLVMDGVTYRHGDIVRKDPGKTALEYVSRYAASYAIGHCHRMATVQKRVGDSVLTGIECGCLCSMKAAYDYCYKPDWCRGYIVVRDGVPEQIKLER